MATANFSWTPASTTGNQRIYYRAFNAGGPLILSAIVSAVTNSASINSLLDNTIYEIQIVNDCSTGTVGSVSNKQINIICIPFADINPDVNEISYDFLGADGDITGITVDLLDATGTTVLQTDVHTNPGPMSYGIGTFSGLSSLTTYRLRLTITAGTFSKTCASVTTTTTTTGLYITNVDFDNDSVCGGSGDTGLALYDNTSAAWILGNPNAGAWASSNFVGNGQTTIINPIPGGDDFLVSAYKGCGIGGSLAHDAWIQVRDQFNAIVDLDPSTSNTEIKNTVNLTGYGVALGWHIFVRKPFLMLPFPVYFDSSPSGGGTHYGDLMGLAPAIAGPGGGIEHAVPGDTPTGGNYDGYLRGVKVNPFGSLPGNNILVTALAEDPDGNTSYTSTSGYPVFAILNGLSYFFAVNPALTQAERFITKNTTDLALTSNQGNIAVDNTSAINHPVINTVTRSGSNVTINYTWTAGAFPTGVPSKYDFYIVVIKNRGLLSEQVTHIPLTINWAMPVDPAFIPFSHTAPTVGTILSEVKSISVPGSYTTLEVRITTLISNQISTNVESILNYHTQLFSI